MGNSGRTAETLLPLQGRKQGAHILLCSLASDDSVLIFIPDLLLFIVFSFDVVLVNKNERHFSGWNFNIRLVILWLQLSPF